MAIVEYKQRGDVVKSPTLSASVITAGQMVRYSTAGTLTVMESTPAGRRPIGVAESDAGGANGSDHVGVTMFDGSKIFQLNLGSAAANVAGNLVKLDSATTVTQITSSTDISNAVGEVVENDSTSDTDVKCRFWAPGPAMMMRYIRCTTSDTSTTSVFSFSVLGIPNMADALYLLLDEKCASGITAITKSTCSFTLTHTISASAGVGLFRWGLETKE